MNGMIFIIATGQTTNVVESACCTNDNDNGVYIVCHQDNYET